MVKMKMMRDKNGKMKYPVFLQALVLTIVVMLIGMYIGMSMEQNRLVKVNDYFVESEVMLLDVMAHDNMISSLGVSCDELEKSNINLLNDIYSQAILLEEYEKSGKITDTIKVLHKKYDALRSYMWINSIKIKEKCGSDFDTIVYLYNYDEKELTKKAEQNVWSKVLYEIKQEKGDSVVLIPMAVDTNLKSLDILLKEYSVDTYPSVLINEDIVFDRLVDKEDILAVLN